MLRVVWTAFCMSVIECSLLRRATIDPPSGNIELDGNSNVVVIGDIHGDKMSFIHSLWLAFSDLEMAEISFDEFAANLEAGSTPMAKKSMNSVLIQLGDVIDRGPDGLACLEILDGIEKTIGWTTVRLYGNHELMSHLGKSDAFIADEEREIFADRFGSVDARIKEFQSGGSVWSKIVEKSLLLAPAM